MAKPEPRQISVFIASPGDLSPERKIFKDTVDDLNAGFADGAGVRFVPLGWEDLPAESGRRVQGVINQQIEECDLFILALNRIWGQDAPDSKFSSYTEEEFQFAFNLWDKKKSPEVLIFFKTVDNASVADPGPELTKVLEFRKKLASRHDIWPRSFNSDVDFGTEIDRHLRLFAKGQLSGIADDTPPIVFPKPEVDALAKAEDAEAKADLSLVEAQQTDLTMARAAVDAANAGRIQDARILFAKATESTTELSILSVAAEFFRQIGDTDNSSRLVGRQAAIARDRSIAVRHYLALMPPGFLSQMNEQVLAQMLASYPPDDADEIRSIYEEAFGGGRIEKIMFDMMVKYYTETEMVQLARFLASPVGQSSLQKQQAMMLELMQFGAEEFARILLKRHPELAAEVAGPADMTTQPPEGLPAAPEANQLPAGGDDKSLAAQGGSQPNKIQ